jgi:hypothetical protein
VSNSTRPSSSNSYDERFVVPLEASRRGAHRARVSPVMAILPVASVVGVVVGAIALVYLFLGGMGGSDAGLDATAKVTPSASATGTAAPAVSGATPGSSSSSSTLAPGSVDKTVTLDVFNGTVTSGLAKKAGNKLVAAGWTTGRVETWTGAPVAQTTVYYAQDDQKATALAIVKILGRGTAKLSPSRAGTGMAVVIGPDYPGAGAARGGTAPTGRSTGVTSTRNSSRTAGGQTATSRTGATGATGSSSSTAGGKASASSSTASSSDTTPTTASTSTN